MKSFFAIFLTLFIALLIISNISIKAQVLPVIRNEHGDTIHYQWPIPDSLL